jgi:hypothetical protein
VKIFHISQAQIFALQDLVDDAEAVAHGLPTRREVEHLVRAWWLDPDPEDLQRAPEEQEEQEPCASLCQMCAPLGQCWVQP